MNDHTPEPWTIGETTLDIVRGFVTPEAVGAFAIYDKNRTVIAYVPSDYKRKRQAANARLIAAAPKLLGAGRAMLKAADTLMDEVTNKRATNWGVVNEAMCAMSAAIRAATELLTDDDPPGPQLKQPIAWEDHDRISRDGP